MFKKGSRTGLAASIFVGISAVLMLGWAWQSTPGYSIEPGIKTVESAFINRQTNLMAEVNGRVVRIISDDTNRARHQRFVIQLANGQNILVAHNIGYADRVPVSLNEPVTVRGQYSWNENGGLIHWTHHDVSLNRRHGWIDHEGLRYE